MKFEMTRMMKLYLFRLAFRILVFLLILKMYLTNPVTLWYLLTSPIYHGITLMRVIWFIFMAIMIMHLFPSNFRSMALRKRKPENFNPVPNYNELELHRFVQRMNYKAWIVMLSWLALNGVFGSLYLAGILKEADLLMLTTFFFLSDYICILFFCPFQTKIMKNRCCVNCRIYDWGHFMMFTPMLFIRNFYSWSLFFTACVVLIHWELVYAKHPERFWNGSNQTIQCSNCKDKTCQIKNKLAHKTPNNAIE